MDTSDSKETSHRTRHRKRAQQPKSAQAYEQWKSQHAEKFAATPVISKLIKPPQVSILDDRTSKVLHGDMMISVEDESQDKTSDQIRKVLDHAALVQKQSKDAKLAKREVFRLKAREEMKEEKARRNQPFRFRDLPSELREMVYRLVFSCGHRERGKKPSLLWALKDFNKLYLEARKVWCETNDFKFSLLESAVNTRDGLEDGELGLVRWGTLIVSKDIKTCSKLSPAVLQARNLENLTLKVASKLGLALAIHQIIPHLKKLKQITLRFGCGQSRMERKRYWNQGIGELYEVYRDSVETRRALDKTLGVEAKFMKDEGKPWMQVWVWKVEGKYGVLKSKEVKKHIKFD